MTEQKRRRSSSRSHHVTETPNGNRTIFALLFVIPIVITLAFGGTDTWALMMLFTMISLLGGTWIVHSIRRGEFQINADTMLLPIVGLIVLGLFQLMPLGNAGIPEGVINASPSNALTQDQFATRIFLARLFCYLIFFAAALTFINTNARLRKAAFAIIIFGGVLAFGAILQKLASPDAIYGIRETPQAIPFGPYVNQHHFASLMVLLSGIAIAHIFGDGVSKQSKLLIAISALIMGISVPMTSSRGGVISYAAMIFMVVLFTFARKGSRKIERLIPAIGGLLVIGIIGVGSILFLGGSDSLLRGIGMQASADISSGRLHFWSVAFEIFKANPIFGAGLDAFGVAYTKFDTWNGRYRVEQAHNDYLQAMADGGIIGFACIVGFVVLFVKKGYSRIATAGIFQRVTAVGAFAGCAGVLIHSFFDFPLRTAGNGFFFLLVATLAVLPLTADPSED
jgi:O-antigen ligase